MKTLIIPLNIFERRPTFDFPVRRCIPPLTVINRTVVTDEYNGTSDPDKSCIWRYKNPVDFAYPSDLTVCDVFADFKVHLNP